MNQEYSNLFKRILKANAKNNIDKELKKIFDESDKDKQEIAKTICSLCGVSVEYINDEQFIQEIKESMKNYKSNAKIIQRIHECRTENKDDNGKTLCQRSCPFNAVLKDDEKIYIDENICTECGQCVVACECGGLVDKVEFMPLFEAIKSDAPVVAVVAPAIAGQFGENVTLAQMRTAFQKVGFADMVEVAFFADMLTLKEAIEFGDAVKNGEDIVMTTCCCPMWFGMVKKSYDKITKNACPTVSPMIAAGRVLKKLNPDYKIVFIGPCIAKKAEAKNEGLKGAIDFVLTFEEIKNIFEALDINPSELKETYTSDYASKQGRSYARAGGVSLSIASAVKAMFPEEYSKLKIAKGNGVKECRELLSNALSGELDANFIEGMGCTGGCVGGPKAILKTDEGKEMVEKTAEESNIDVSLNNECMKAILKHIGINGIDDFRDKEKTKIFEREIL